MNLVEVRYENTAVVQEKPEVMGLTMQQISTDFHDVFTGEGHLEKKLHLEIDTTIEPVRQPVRRILVAMKPKLKEELAHLEKLGVVKPVVQANRLKPNGKL